MEFMQRVSLAARSASLRLPPPRVAAGPCIAGLPPGRTPVTCATGVARSDMSWGLTPKTGPKRSIVERDLPHLCVPFCADFSRSQRKMCHPALGAVFRVTGGRGMGTRIRILLLAFFALALASCGGSNKSGVPKGAPGELSSFADEWPAPNQDLGNRRVATSKIDSGNVDQLGVAWTIPIKGGGTFGNYASTPIVADGVA